MNLLLTMDHVHHTDPAFTGSTGVGGQWPDHGSGYTSHHQSPIQEFTGFAFNPLAAEPIFTSRNIMQPSRSMHQQLQPLIMPSTQWPSLLTRPSPYAQTAFPSSSVPSMPHSRAPLSTPLSAPPTTGRSSNPRRTLTDTDRRRMCLYAEEHPTTKQTDIGNMFGVERSTVSKVLRNKDKYLSQEDGNRSPVRKQKGKLPDIERALSNWAKNAQKQGLPISDAMIKEKFKFFANTVGNGNSDILSKVISSSWLEKFKQKNGLFGVKSRKGSLIEEHDSSTGRTSARAASKSPASPANEAHDRPPIEVGVNQKISVTNSPSKEPPSFGASPKPYHSLSNESLASAYSAAQSSFSPSQDRPASPLFSPDPAATATSPFFPPSQLSASTNPVNSFHRPRSQTFPTMLGLEPFASPPCSDPTPKYVPGAVSLDISLPGISSSLSTLDDNTFASTILMQPPAPPMSASSSVMAPGVRSDLQTQSIHTNAMTIHNLPSQASSRHHTPVLPHSSPATPGSSFAVMPNGSPTLEDTTNAMQIVISYFQHQPNDVLNSSELIFMGGLMEKLKLQQNNISSLLGHSGEMPGGMHRLLSADFQ